MPSWFVNASVSCALTKPAVIATVAPVRFASSLSVTVRPESITTAPAFSVYARLPAVVVTTGDAFGAATVIVNDCVPDVFELGGVLLPLSLKVTLKVAVPLVPLVAVYVNVPVVELIAGGVENVSVPVVPFGVMLKVNT